MHIYCWDLDRTYLDTDIHSVRGMVRAALEPASEKRNIPGSATLLRSMLRFDLSSRAMVLSGSPTQLRTVLEQKLALDGISFESMHLKNSLRNIRRGRFRAVRDQVGYKLPRLLSERVARDPKTGETLFGDDSEADAVIYAAYAEAIAGRLGAPALEDLMTKAGAYDDQIDSALQSLGRIEPSDAVQDIFIHVDRRRPLADFDELGSKVYVVFSWYQAALVMWARERLDALGVAAVARRCAEVMPLARTEIIALTQDAVRRGLIHRADVMRLFAEPSALTALREEVTLALDILGPFRRPRASGTPRYDRFLG